MSDNQLIVVKYGGSLLGKSSGPLVGRDIGPDPVLADCAQLVSEGARVVVVHGGGPQIDTLIARLELPQERIDGLRVTDAATLEIVEAVLCGNVNKALVRAALRQGMRAIGISGEDGGMLRARALQGVHDLGFVGEIVGVDPSPLRVLIDAGYVSVVAPLAIGDDLTTVYNVNADTAAGKIAAALGADAYVAITDVPRLRRSADPASAMARASAAEIAELIASGGINGGMIPKVEAALIALEGGARRAFIGGAAERPVSGALAGDATEVFG